MDQLHEYISHQLNSKQVEPNDSLGKAMRYMLKHWHETNHFFQVIAKRYEKGSIIVTSNLAFSQWVNLP